MKELTTSSQGRIAKEMFAPSPTAQLAQITFVRVAPTFLKEESLALSDAAISALVRPPPGLTLEGSPARYGFYKRMSVPLVRQFLQEEEGRPDSGQYVYVHALMPHSPYVWDGD